MSKLVRYYLDNISKDWQDILGKMKYSRLLMDIEEEYQKDQLVPRNMYDVLAPFVYCQPHEVKLIIVMNAPDCANSQSNGLICGSHKGVSNLAYNMVRELQAEYNTDIQIADSSLRDWAKQGVLLLNASPISKSSYDGYYTEMFTEFTNKLLDHFEYQQNCVFWHLGFDRPKKNYYTALIPMKEDGIFGSDVFLTINAVLVKMKKEPIDWLKIKREKSLYDIRKFMLKAGASREGSR